MKKLVAQAMQYVIRQQKVITTLADPSTPPVVSTEMTVCELIIHWNGKRRTIFLECMLWDELPNNQDIIVSMPDALDTGLIAFALPHAWRRSWLGTAAFSNQLPAALRKDQSWACTMHQECVRNQHRFKNACTWHCLRSAQQSVSVAWKDLLCVSQCTRHRTKMQTPSSMLPCICGGCYVEVQCFICRRIRMSPVKLFAIHT